MQTRRLGALLPPSSSALLLGVLFGVASRAAGLAAPLRFSPDAFFYALLPPIVLSAGFALETTSFFDNVGAIAGETTRRRCLFLCRFGYFHTFKPPLSNLHSRSLPDTPPPARPAFAFLGTFISALVFAFATYFLYLIGLVRGAHLGGAPFAECLMYGSALSSIDPVATLAVLAHADAPPLLYALVSSESILNDAVAITLFNSIASYSRAHGGAVGFTTLPAIGLRFAFLAAGSTAVGVGVALACAALLKRFQGWHEPASAAAPPPSSPHDAAASDHQPPPHHHRHPRPAFDPALYEISVVLVGSYLAYLLAEVAGMSGIVALFFTGAAHQHYSQHSVSAEARVALRRVLEVAAFLSELFVFAYLGLQVATQRHAFDFG